jgi:hypothetical protein
MHGIGMWWAVDVADGVHEEKRRPSGNLAHIGIVGITPVVLGLVTAPIPGEVTVRVSRAVRGMIRNGKTLCSELGIRVVIRGGRVVRATPRGRGKPSRGDAALKATVKYRVTPAEFARATEIARDRGQSVHDFARSLLEREMALG